ncbi:MAG: 30S ribosomal protein S6 [Lentisphaeria bacterium]|jgi:ribosomal protein S6|nr:30S ribosomal protein S6 [Lentisphaeria bacterium]NLZ60286.1 30S ribosomal protein S6 [Lentisphaerota bacterium]
MPRQKEKLKVIKYEAVFILDPRKVEGNGEEFSAGIVEQIQALGGKMRRVKCLDKRVFARPIGKHKTGVYWDFVAEMSPGSVEKLQDKYRLNKTVLRLAAFKFVEGQDDEVFKPREERLFKEENFQDDMFEERSYRNYRSR